MERSHSHPALMGIKLCVAVLGLSFWAGVAQEQSSNPFEPLAFFFDPNALGLAVGEQVPAIEGVDFSKGGTVLVFSMATCCKRYYPLLQEWMNALPELQMAIVVGGTADAGEAVGVDIANAVLIPDPDLSLRARYRLTQDTFMMVTFLLNSNGNVVFRWTGFRESHWRFLTEAVQYFAQANDVPPGILIEHVLHIGEPLPPFQIEVLDGQEYSPDTLLGRPSLLYFMVSDVQFYDYVNRDIEAIHQQFGDQVNVIGITTWLTAEAIEQGREYAQTHHLDTSWFLKQPENSEAAVSDWLDTFSKSVQKFPITFPIHVDWNDQLGHQWLILASPVIVLLDSEGNVNLISLYPSEEESAQAKSTLIHLIEQMN